jgi:hypothetical protein
MTVYIPFNTPPGKCPDCKGSGKCNCGQCPNGVCVPCQGTGEWPEVEIELELDETGDIEERQ